jgi:hypothetical protein
MRANRRRENAPHTFGPLNSKGTDKVTTFAGSWDVTIDTPIGKLAVVFDITEQNGAIHGTARSDAETVDFVDAVADGNRLTWSQDVTTPMQLNLKFDVTVEGDTMTGTSKAGFLPASKLYGSRSSSP